MSEREKYFIEVQTKEREYIKALFENYFAKRGCSNLVTTPLTGYSSTDASLTSGKTNVTIEYKRRSITTNKYNDTFIERTKFIALYEAHKRGDYTLFIIEYDDYYLLFDLSYEYMLYRPYIDCDYVFFRPVLATANNFNYQKGGREKYIRDLKFYDATYILDKCFIDIGYKKFLDIRLK